MAVNSGDVERGSQRLARVLLRDVERIAQRSAARMQELMPAYARVPRHELTPVVLTNTRNLLEAIRDPSAERTSAEATRRLSGDSRARQGITSDEMLHGWRIGLDSVREEAHVVAAELGLGTDVLLEFIEATLRWGDVGMRASASAHHEAEIRELGRLVEEQAALRRVATLVAQGAPSERLFAVVAEQVARVLDVPLVSIATYDADGKVTERARFSERERGELFPVGKRWRLDGSSVLSRARAAGRPARINDYAGLKGDIAESVNRVGARSTVGIPITVAGRMWGAIRVSSVDAPLPADTEARLTDFTELLATAIANTDAQAEVERLAEGQAALRRVATLVAHGVPSEELFDAVCEEVGRLVGADLAGMARYEADDSITVLPPWTPEGRRPEMAGRVSLEGARLPRVVRETGRAAREDAWDEVAVAVADVTRDQLGARSAVGSPILVEGEVWGALFVSSRQAPHMPADTESRLESFTELLATAMANTHARAEVARLAEEQAALRRVATMVARESPAEEVLAKVAEEVALLLGSDFAVIRRFEPDARATVVGSWGDVGDGFGAGPLKLDGHNAGALVYRTQRPVRLDDYEYASGSIAEEARGLGLRCVVATPIVVHGRLWGVIAVATTRAERMPADAESRMAQFTDLVATSISNVQARSDLAASRARIAAAADEERRRVVRDLHDGAQQRLVHSIVTLKMARGALDRDPRDAAALVDEALEQTATANDELRELAHGILPSVLTHGGLGAAVRALASRMSIPVEIDISVDRLPRAVEASAYFVVAEALTNVAKHSRAERATVRARLERRALEVEVADDGVGGARGDGSGLVGLSDRLAALDGRLRVESPADGGTRIAASIPVRQRRDARRAS